MSDDNVRTGLACDVCGAFDPPRQPYWRSNTEKVCDPCWDRIESRLAEREAAQPASSEGLREALANAIIEQWAAATDGEATPADYDDDDRAQALAEADFLLARLPLAATPAEPEAAALDERIREQLWRAHGHYFIYGDDGEMQCNWSHDHADFKRDTMERLLRHCDLARLARASGPDEEGR